MIYTFVEVLYLLLAISLLVLDSLDKLKIEINYDSRVTFCWSCISLATSIMGLHTVVSLRKLMK
jgi:hypothetical protein